jgi:hypothetical protein
MAAEPSPAAGTVAPARATLVRGGRWLAWFTIGWNALEGLVAIATGLAAGSTARPSRPTPPRPPCACGCRPSCSPASASTPCSAGGGRTRWPPSGSSTSPPAKASRAGGPSTSTTAVSRHVPDPAASEVGGRLVSGPIPGRMEHLEEWRRRHRPLDPHTQRVCLTIGFARFRLPGSRRESSLGPAKPGMEGGAMPDLRAIRQPRLGSIVTADHVIPPAARLAMAGTPRPTSSRSTPPTCR